MRLINNGAYTITYSQSQQEKNHIELVTIIGIFQNTMLQNRGFAGGYPSKNGSKKSQNAEVRLAGRARVYTVAKVYKLKPETIELIRMIAESNKCTESAVSEGFLRKIAELKIHDARARIP